MNYYDTHKKERLAYQRLYNMENREKIREYNRNYFLKRYQIKRNKRIKQIEQPITIVKGDFNIHIYE